MSKTPSDFRRANELSYLLSLLPQPPRPALAAKFGESLDASRRRRELPAANSTASCKGSSESAARSEPQPESQCRHTAGAAPAHGGPAPSSSILSPFNVLSNEATKNVPRSDTVCSTAAGAASCAQAMRALIKRCVALARKHGTVNGKIGFVPVGFPGTTITLARNAEGWAVDVRCSDGWSARTFSNGGGQLNRQFELAGLGSVELAVRREK